MAKVKVLRHRESGVIHGWNAVLAKRFDMEEIYVGDDKSEAKPKSNGRLPKFPKATRANLIEAFGSTEGIKAATKAELVKVKGVGAKLAQKILDSQK